MGVENWLMVTFQYCFGGSYRKSGNLSNKVIENTSMEVFEIETLILVLYNVFE
jgi:hypothetical protein